jgi:hypothetical protein
MVASKHPQYHPEPMSLVGHVWDVLMRALPRTPYGCFHPPEWEGTPAARRADLEVVEKLLTAISA